MSGGHSNAIVYKIEPIFIFLNLEQFAMPLTDMANCANFKNCHDDKVKIIICIIEYYRYSFTNSIFNPVCICVCMYLYSCKWGIMICGLIAIYWIVHMCERVSISIMDMAHICDNVCMICIARAIVIMQLYTILVRTMKLISLIAMCISKLKLLAFHRITFDLSQFYLDFFSRWLPW